MLTIAIVVLVAAVATFLLVAASKPGTFRIERSAVINTRPDVIHGHINDFHKWQAWSPWERLDPDLKRTFSGSEAGVGAVYDWSGNAKAGVGRMTITDSTPSNITVRLEFIKPFAATNTTTFVLEPQGEATRLIWTMTGPQTFMFKVMGTIFNMDQKIGEDFEKGLAGLRSVSEAALAA